MSHVYGSEVVQALLELRVGRQLPFVHPSAMTRAYGPIHNQVRSKLRCLLEKSKNSLVSDASSSASARTSLDDTWKIHVAEEKQTETGRRFKCRLCGQSGRYLSDIRVHILSVHLKFRSYVCRICSASFQTSSKLARHTHIHENRRDFHCPMCPRTFPYRSGLHYHLQTTHAQDKQHHCSHLGCHLKFARLCDLQRHLRTHSGDRVYECLDCHERFSRGDTLKKHQLTNGEACRLRRKRHEHDGFLAQCDPWSSNFRTGTESSSSTSFATTDSIPAVHSRSVASGIVLCPSTATFQWEDAKLESKKAESAPPDPGSRTFVPSARGGIWFESQHMHIGRIETESSLLNLASELGPSPLGQAVPRQNPSVLL